MVANRLGPNNSVSSFPSTSSSDTPDHPPVATFLTMDTPDPDVVKDSQQSRSNVTPKSAAFGSPIATQDSWTAPPRRRQFQQKAKASFLSDDDDGNNDEQDQQNGTDAANNPPKQSDGDPDLDYISYDFESGLNGETREDQDVYNQSPTPRASQAARLPPQSAQPAPRSSMTESSDEFEVFEALKKQSADAKTSNDPFKIPNHHEPAEQRQQQASATRDRPVSEGKKGPPAKDTRKPRAVARKSLANSKVKLAALEVEGETETRKSEIQAPPEYDYSLPASNSSSPAAAPPKKRASAKEAVKKPATRPKGTAREARSSNGGRAEHTKYAPDSQVYCSPEQNEDMLLADNPPKVIQPPHEANPSPQMKRRKLEPGQPPNESQKQVADMGPSDSTSSFPESENTDDEDFECSRKMTPSNARRRTRAAAAESQAARAAKTKAGSKPAALPTAPRQDVEDRLDATERSKIQPKQPPKKTAVEKTQAVTARNEEEMKSSTEKSKKKGSASRKLPANRTSKDNSDVKQKTVVPSNNDCVGRDEADELCHKSEPFKQATGTGRKPNIVAFGPGGPKNNGKSHKTTATDSRSSVQHSSPKKTGYPAVTKSQLLKGLHRTAKLQPSTKLQDGDSPINDSAGHAEDGDGRTARANRSTVAGPVPENHPISQAADKETMPNVDAELATPNYETERGEASDQFVARDAEAGSAVEIAAKLTAHSQEYQQYDMGNAFDNGDEKASSPLAQVDITHLHSREQRTVLGRVDANYRSSPRDIPAGVPRQMKRKFPDTMIVEERSPIQQALPAKNGSQPGSFPRLRMKPKAFNLPSAGVERLVKKPRYNPAHSEGVNADAGYGSNLVGGPGILSRGGDDTGDDVFGPGKSDKPVGSSAFVQRLVSNESADRGPGQPGRVGPASFDTNTATRQNAIAIGHAAEVRNAAPGVPLRPQGREQLDDVAKRMLAALEPAKEQVPDSWPPSDDPSKGCLVGNPTETLLGDAFDQRRASDMDERTRAWKEATEPYDDSLGKTMHRIVNVSSSPQHHVSASASLTDMDRPFCED